MSKEKPSLLFDASSILAAIKLKRIDLLHEQHTQRLTTYELCNAIWKEAHLLKKLTKEQAHQLLDILIEILNNMNIIEIHHNEQEIIETAFSTGLSTCDTSYIVLAKKHKLTLVTEDEKLRHEASKQITTTSVPLLTNQNES